MVYSLRNVEEEPYALCRFLRPAKFDADKMLERLEKSKDRWNEAKAQDFYPNLELALGVPLGVFISQYPFVTCGHAKNGTLLALLSNKIRFGVQIGLILMIILILILAHRPNMQQAAPSITFWLVP
jgi:hypothetical protein